MDGRMRSGTTSGRSHPDTHRVGRSRAVILAVAVTGGIVASVALISSRHSSGIASPSRVAAAVGAHRVVRARLTGGYAYVPCRRAQPNDSLVDGLVCDETPPSAWPESHLLTKLAQDLRSSIGQGTGAGAHHTLGSWNLIWRNADAAIDELRQAAALEPSSAPVQSDLAAALLERAEIQQDPLSILLAYAAADSAVTLGPDLPEAHFNRAIALEQLHLRDMAAQQWEAYLRLDDASPWTEEAQEQLKQLRSAGPAWSAVRRELWSGALPVDTTVERIARQFPRRMREEGRAVVLAWARARDAGEPSDALRRRAKVIAQAVKQVTGDAFLSDLVSSIENDVTAGDRARATALARGLVAYEKGHAWLGAFELDSASQWLGQAHQALRMTGSPADHWVAFDSAMIPYQRAGLDGYETALRHLRRLQARTPAKYRVMRGLTVRTEGLIHAIRADYDAAIAAYRAATIEGSGTGDPGLEVRPRGILASLYADLRGEEDAWRELYAAFKALGSGADEPADAQRLFVTAADLSSRRWPAIALLFQHEAVKLAREVDGPGTMTISALAKEAELLTRQGLVPQALDRLREARAATDSIASDSIRAIKTADVDLVEGEVWLRSRPDSAVQVLRRSVDRFQDTQYLLEMDRAQLLLANAYAAYGNMDAARLAFDAALSETERRRAGLLSSDDRARFLDQARPVIDQIVGFHIDRADTLGALQFFERMRARVLLERVRGSSPRTDRGAPGATIDRLRRTLPAGTTLISYAVLDGELVSWLIGGRGIAMRRIPITVPLERTVARFSSLIEERSSSRELQAISAQLHTLLIAPWRDRLQPDTRLVIVPDKWLHFIPFGALFDETTGRFLVESFEITVAPSVELYQASVARYGELGTATPSVLAVGNPTFDENAFELPRLPGAEREATRIAADYSRARLLLGPAATKSAFLRDAAASDIVHFAGHGVVTPDAPLLSHLVFAPELRTGASGALYARDLFDIRLPRTRVAILSGCQTAGGRLSDTEGASSLARALFAAGVPAVIASLWAVNDAGTADFFAAYHRELSRGADPATALRKTQRQWLANSEDRWRGLSTWAGFQLFGATGGRGSP
jgi:CHAT domain-containing protein/tetratricopeptide (TPR) repeat protein